MEQELIYKRIAVIGCGAAGGLACVLLLKNPYNKVTAFDIKEPFSTLLPTGGGRCNLTYDEKELRELVKNYPRGEKFLISVFSRFSPNDTRKLFEDLGVKTYVQNDKRVFPISDSALRTVQILSNHLKTPDFFHKKEKVTAVKKLEKEFEIITNKGKYRYDTVIIAAGGHSNGFELAKSFAHKIIEPKPSLCALDIEEKYLYSLPGLSFKSVMAKTGKKEFEGDLLFTHKSLSGPLAFKLSAYNAFKEISKENPLEITFCLNSETIENIELEIKNNPKKSIKNVFSKFIAQNYIITTAKVNGIDVEKQCAQLNKKEKEIIINSIKCLKVRVHSFIKDSEIVTAGGVDLDEINPKTMESKLVKGLYFIGEILNIDGFTGGFNLQNCWSGAYLCSKNINET